MNTSLDTTTIPSALLEALGISAATLPKVIALPPNRGDSCGASRQASRLTDAEYAALLQHLPLPRRPSLDHRDFLDVILGLEARGWRWTAFTQSDAVRKKFERWSMCGVWERLASSLDPALISPDRANQLARVADRGKAQRLRTLAQRTRASVRPSP